MTCLDLLGWMGHRSSSHLTDHERHHRHRQHGRPARHAGTAEQHGRPARQTNTADQHGRPARQTSAADQQMVAEDPRKRRSLNIGLFTRCQRLRPTPSWQEHASSTSRVPFLLPSGPRESPKRARSAQSYRQERARQRCVGKECETAIAASERCNRWGRNLWRRREG